MTRQRVSCDWSEDSKGACPEHTAGEKMTSGGRGGGQGLEGQCEDRSGWSSCHACIQEVLSKAWVYYLDGSESSLEIGSRKERRANGRLSW